MFSFHKPKIYRSHLGCCICRAKSSSSRFTDSKKYEPEFEKCFRTAEKRSGEICNACVLLVKRWKKLPSGTTRNWQHVVDARAGPGTKSFKNKPISSSEPKKRIFAKPSRPLCKDSKIHLQPMSSSESESEEDDEEMMDDLDGLDNGNSSSITGTGLNSTSSRGQRSLRRSNRLTTGSLGSKHFNRNGDGVNRSSSGTDRNNNLSGKVKNIPKRRTLLTPEHLFSFLDTSFWQKEQVCCGVIFKGPNNEVLIYPELLDSLCGCRKPANFSASVSPNSAVSSECESRLTSSPSSSPIKSSAESASLSTQIPSLVSVSSVLAGEAQPTSFPPPPPPPPAFQHSSDEANKSSSHAEEDLLSNSKKITLQHQDSFPSSDSSSERGGNSSSHETDTDDPSSGVSSMAACDETSMLVPDTDHLNQLNHHHLEQLATMALAERHHLSTVSKVCALMMEHDEEDDEDGGSSSTASTTTDDGLNHHEMEMEVFSEEVSSSPVKPSSSEAVVVLSNMATAVV